VLNAVENADQVVLSSESRHPARLVEQDLSGLKAPSGIRLGISKGQVLHVLANQPAMIVLA